MTWGKIFRRAVFAAFTVIFLLSAVVGATVKLYSATGEDYANEIESQDIAKLRARDKAIKNATKQAGVYLKTYSRSINSELTDDEISAITSNAYELVGEPKYSRTLKQISDNTTIILWTATVEVNVDDSEIQSWIKRDDKDKSTIITQTREAQKSSEENEKKIDDLREKYNRATTQSERDSIIKQMNDADRDFLAIQKKEEGNKLYYAKNYHGAIKLYNEALQLKPDWDWAYNNCGGAYYALGQKELAIQDFDKAIQLNPNDEIAYYNRGIAYHNLKQYKRAIQDFNKAIQLNSNFELSYNNRGLAYHNLKQYERAIQDYDKAIQLNSNLYQAYVGRGAAYGNLGKYERAIQDFNKAIQLNSNYDMAYNNRGTAYHGLGQNERAIQDYDKAIQINPNYAEAYFGRALAYASLENVEKTFADINKAIELSPNNAIMYQTRGMLYQAIGDEEKAQADFAKAKELGYEG